MNSNFITSVIHPVSLSFAMPFWHRFPTFKLNVQQKESQNGNLQNLKESTKDFLKSDEHFFSYPPNDINHYMRSYCLQHFTAISNKYFTRTLWIPYSFHEVTLEFLFHLLSFSLHWIIVSINNYGNRKTFPFPARSDIWKFSCGRIRKNQRDEKRRKLK